MAVIAPDFPTFEVELSSYCNKLSSYLYPVVPIVFLKELEVVVPSLGFDI